MDECNFYTDDCDDNAICTNTIGSYNCTCNDGYTGNGTICYDADECDQKCSLCNETYATTNDANCYNTCNNCNDSEHCVNTIGSYFCIAFGTCADEGWIREGIYCIDVNECEVGRHTCGVGTSCVNNEGSFTCECLFGYGGLHKPYENNTEVCIKGSFKFSTNKSTKGELKKGTPGVYRVICTPE